MATNLESDDGTQAAQSTAGWRGEVSVRMTASDILSLAVNVAQNELPLDGRDLTAMRFMLEGIYKQILDADRRAAEKRLSNRVR